MRFAGSISALRQGKTWLDCDTGFTAKQLLARYGYTPKLRAFHHHLHEVPKQLPRTVASIPLDVWRPELTSLTFSIVPKSQDSEMLGGLELPLRTSPGSVKVGYRVLWEFYGTNYISYTLDSCRGFRSSWSLFVLSPSLSISPSVCLLQVRGHNNPKTGRRNWARWEDHSRLPDSCSMKIKTLFLEYHSNPMTLHRVFR